MWPWQMSSESCGVNGDCGRESLHLECGSHMHAGLLMIVCFRGSCLSVHLCVPLYLSICQHMHICSDGHYSTCTGVHSSVCTG